MLHLNRTQRKGCGFLSKLNTERLLTDDYNPLLIPVETNWAAQCNTAERQHSVQACRCPLHSLTPCPATAPPLLSPSSCLHFLLVYLLCRRSQASNWLVGLIWQHPPPSPSFPSPPLLFPLSVSPSKDFWLIQRPPRRVAEEKSESNGRTERERERWGKRENKGEMGCLYYLGVKLCDPFDKRSSFWLRMRGEANCVLLRAEINIDAERERKRERDVRK